MKTNYILICLFLLFQSPWTFSQGAPEKKPDTIQVKNLGEVNITATRTNIPLRINPAATSVVSEITLSKMPRSIAADEALYLVPGVRVENQANGSRVHLSMRGQGILTEKGLRGIKVMLDGINLNDPSGFVPDLYDIDWETVGRIEVIRGPAASFYGGGGNGGILNVITKNGGNKPAGGMFYASAGSNGFFKVLGQADGTEKDVTYRVSASHMQGDGYRAHTAFWGDNVSLKTTWTPSGNVSFTPVINYSDYFNQNAEGLNLDQVEQDPKQANPDAIPCNEYQKTIRLIAGLTGQVKLAPGHRLDMSLFYRTTDFKETGSRAVDYRNYYAPGGTLQYNWDALLSDNIRNHFSVGTDLQWQNVSQYKLPNIKDTTRTESKGHPSQDVTEGTTLLANQVIDQFGMGSYLIDRVEIGRHFSVMISARYDYMKNELTDKMPPVSDSVSNLSGNADFRKGTGRLGLAWYFNKSISLYANVGQGFLPPSTEELASNPVSFGGFNEDLEPSTSVGGEIGIRGTLMDRLYYELDGFYLQTTNDFYRYRMADRPLETFYGNIGASNRLGSELFVSYTPWDPLNIQLAYTLSDFRYSEPDSIDGNFLPNCPVNMLAGKISYRFLKHFSAEVSTQWQSKWYIYTDEVHQDVTQEGYNLWNLRLGYTWKLGPFQGELSVFGKNLFDEQYIAFTEPDPDGNCYQPGAGREFFVELRVRF